MRSLEKLLEGVEVEWKALGEVCDFQNGFAFKSHLFKDFGLPIVRITNIDGSNVDLTEVKHFDPIDYDSGNPLNYSIEKGDVLIAMSGATTGKIGYYNLNEVAYLNQRVGKFIPKRHLLNNRYLFHFLLTKADFLYVLAGGGAQPNLSSNSLKEKLQIPIPCPENPKKSLEIQKEIVRILDTFTELTAELTAEFTAELTARKKQYAYYREELFNFDEEKVKYFPLGDDSIGKFTRGGGLQKKDFTKTGFACIHYGQIYTYYGTYATKTKTFVSEEFAKKARKAKSGDLVIATTSENDEDVCKAVAWLGEDEVAVSSDACFYTHNLNSKYVAYFFQTEQFQKQKRPLITGTKVRRVNADNLAKIKIPVPSPEEQERIVAILDKFDILTTSISEGLPKEIELRRKQYEYYRDMLLTFPKDNLEA